MCLHGPPVGTEGEFTRHGLIPVLNSEPQVAGWRAHAAALDRELDAIVQVDTGMSRMGMSPQEIDGWLADAHFLDGIKVLYLMSHLACADERYHPANAQQLARFLEIRARLPQYACSLANSSGVFLSPDYHFDLVRPGAALYGITPQAGEPNPLQSVVRLQGKVIQTRSINAGDHVGYSCRYTATGPCVVATVSVGYADGWLRSMSNQGVAVIDGVRVPQVGAISMDSITLDVSNIDAGAGRARAAGRPDLPGTPGRCGGRHGPHHRLRSADQSRRTVFPRIYRSCRQPPPDLLACRRRQYLYGKIGLS